MVLEYNSNEINPADLDEETAKFSKIIIGPGELGCDVSRNKILIVRNEWGSPTLCSLRLHKTISF